MDLYSPREIALAAGVAEADVLAALAAARASSRRLAGGHVSRRASEAAPAFVAHDEAVRIGRVLARATSRPAPVDSPSSDASEPERHIPQSRGVPLAVSSAVHAALVAALFLATFNLSPSAASLHVEDRPAEPMRLVFLASPGPGGGGGGGGLLQKTPAPKALREGTRKISSPLPQRVEPKPIEPAPKPPEPKPQPPLAAEQLPAVVAPIIVAPADTKNRVGVLAQTTADADSHGPGAGGGAGTGKGTGLGEGDGSGIGPGSGGGTGGGPYRPGSGIEPPRLLREVKADYTEEARQRGLSGEVVLEIVVRRDGSVGDVKILQGMAAGLNDRAVQAVKQWRFTPARRQGAPVDVIVEVAVEFRLR
jgi:periplasmic protein TonB